MQKIKEYSAICVIGSVGYSIIEVLWRGFTHWTMGVTGGVGFLMLYLTDFRMEGRGLLQRCLAGSAVLTSVEFISGCFVNCIFRMDVWDYSQRIGNVLGQVCPLYSFLWFLLCIPVMPLSAALRRGAQQLHGGPSPRESGLPNTQP